jgi:hypothetical protein
MTRDNANKLANRAHIAENFCAGLTLLACIIGAEAMSTWSESNPDGSSQEKTLAVIAFTAAAILILSILVLSRFTMLYNPRQKQRARMVPDQRSLAGFRAVPNGWTPYDDSESDVDVWARVFPRITEFVRKRKTEK